MHFLQFLINIIIILNTDELSDSLNLLAYQPALCLLFGMKMADFHPGRPIGLVEAAWGGTPIEAWVSKRVTDSCQTEESKGYLFLLFYIL
jgi:hypothetical protein